MSDRSRRRSPSPDRHRSSRHRSRSKSPRRRHRSRSPESSRHPTNRHHSKSPERSRRRSVSSSKDSHRRRQHRSRSPSPDSRRHRRHRSRSSSVDSRKKHSERRSRRKHSPSSSDSSSSESDSEDDHRRRKRRREDKKKRKDKKDKKKKKKSKKKSKLSAVGDQWGKYGLIHESDIFSKEAEFQAWLIEVKGENVEILNNNKRKEMFVDFMEDYNTATMPHEKFYDISKYELKQQSIRMGDPMPVKTTDTFDFHNDEERLRTQHRQAARLAASRQPTLMLSEEQIKELTRVNRERVEADRMRKMGLKPKESMGVRYEEE